MKELFFKNIANEFSVTMDCQSFLRVDLNNLSKKDFKNKEPFLPNSWIENTKGIITIFYIFGIIISSI
jgi:hypothetical protein